MTEQVRVLGGPRVGRRPHDGRALNALKHGLSMSVVPDHELDAFGRLRARLREELAPVGFLEENLVDRMVRAVWHRERLERWEARLLDERYRRAVERALFPPGGTYEVSFDRDVSASGCAPEVFDLPGAIVAIEDISGRDARQALMDGVPAAGFVPGKCRGGGERVRALYERAARLLSEQLGRASIASDEDLARYQRYAAHHDRDFYRALHELEARQSARRGQPSPLARLEVHGDAGPAGSLA